MIAKELVAASSETIVLSILERGESYGYEIIRRVRDSSGDRIRWTDGMLYPVLHRLEQRGLVRSDWRVAESGRRRKYYRLLARGRRALEENRRQWETVAATLDALWAH